MPRPHAALLWDPLLSLPSCQTVSDYVAEGTNEYIAYSACEWPLKGFGSGPGFLCLVAVVMDSQGRDSLHRWCPLSALVSVPGHPACVFLVFLCSPVILSFLASPIGACLWLSSHSVQLLSLPKCPPAPLCRSPLPNGDAEWSVGACAYNLSP